MNTEEAQNKTKRMANYDEQEGILQVKTMEPDRKSQLPIPTKQHKVTQKRDIELPTSSSIGCSYNLRARKTVQDHDNDLGISLGSVEKHKRDSAQRGKLPKVLVNQQRSTTSGELTRPKSTVSKAVASPRGNFSEKQKNIGSTVEGIFEENWQTETRKTVTSGLNMNENFPAEAVDYGMKRALESSSSKNGPPNKRRKLNKNNISENTQTSKCEPTLTRNTVQDITSDDTTDIEMEDNIPIQPSDKYTEICSVAKRYFPEDTVIWPGYAADDKDVAVIVAEVSNEQTDVPPDIQGLKLIQRQRNSVSNEANTYRESENNIRFSEDDHKTINLLLTKHSPELFKEHSNLQSVSVSKWKCAGAELIPADPFCIVMYVHTKGIIPLGEKPFPKTFHGITVDVREGSCHSFMHDPERKHTLYQANLTMGCLITTGYSREGSVGGFLRLPNKNIGFITCWHLFDTAENRRQYTCNDDLLSHQNFVRDVFQPYPSLEHDFKIGSIVNKKCMEGNETGIGIDAALVEITATHREPRSGEISLTEGNVFDFTEGGIVTTFAQVIDAANRELPVLKWGAKTGLTQGRIFQAGGPCKLKLGNSNAEELLYQQIEVQTKANTPFAVKGDSGSLAFLLSENGSKKELTALGMIVGGNKFSCYLTPIWAVLDSFGLPRQLLSFDEQRFKKLNRTVHDIKTELDTVSRKLNILDNLDRNVNILLDRTKHIDGPRP